MTEPYRIRSVETWAQARDDYLSGLGAEAVCRRYDLGLSAFRRRARKHGWRRIDQPDPAPDDRDLSIYDDIGPDDHIEMARLRFAQALDQGRAVEAARWRRLWRELKAEADAFHDDFFRGMSPAEIAAVLTANPDEEDSETDALLLAMPSRGAQPALAATPAQSSAENVHDVHSIFSSAQFSPDGSPPPSRAERRRREREARRCGGGPQSASASTTPTARPPDTTSPPAIA